MKVKSLTDKINESFRVEYKSDDDYNNTAKIENFDEYFANDDKTSDYRKRNVKLLSEQSIKYKGKITSRKQLKNGQAKHESSESSEDEHSEGEPAYEFRQNYDKFEDSSENESDEKDDNGESNPMSWEENDSYKENGNEAEIRKGVCVKNQLHIWERLLEMRIKIQNLLHKSNQFPLKNNNPYYTSSIAKESTENTCNLLKKLNELKLGLTSQFGELRTHMKRSIEKYSEFSNYVCGSPPLKRIAMQLENQHNQMRSYRNCVLLKWDDRTKLSTPGAGLKKKKEEFDIVRKIESALLNKDVLIAKSRGVKNDTSVQAEDNPNELQFNKNKKLKADVYDDSDFYYQQLREIIEYKTSSSSCGGDMIKQIVKLQKLRQNMKKKVDTRASKGRKIRYAVHKKLINFMAPDDRTTWSEESKDELFKSLFA